MSVDIASCPVHGLHGQRERCYVCGMPCDQVPMVPLIYHKDELAKLVKLIDEMGGGNFVGKYEIKIDSAVSELLPTAVRVTLYYVSGVSPDDREEIKKWIDVTVGLGRYKAQIIARRDSLKRRGSIREVVPL